MSDLPMTEARVLIRPTTEEERFLPEGPRPVRVEGRPALAWVNIQTSADAKSGSIHYRFWDDEQTRILPQPERPGFLIPTNRPDVVLVGMGKHVGTVNLVTNQWQPLAEIPDPNPRTIINDGEPLSDGLGVIFGTKDVQFEDTIAALYLFTPSDGTITPLAEKMICSNGKVFHSGTTLFDIDTPRRQVTRYRFDPKTRSVVEEGVAVDLKEIDGFPDGMADCGDGTAVIAMYNPDPVSDGHAFRFHLTTGERVEGWRVPGSARVTCPLVMELDGSVKLILTTATEGMPSEQRENCPEAGSLFVADIALKSAPPSGMVHLRNT